MLLLHCFPCYIFSMFSAYLMFSYIFPSFPLIYASLSICQTSIYCMINSRENVISEDPPGRGRYRPVSQYVFVVFWNKKKVMWCRSRYRQGGYPPAFKVVSIITLPFLQVKTFQDMWALATRVNMQVTLSTCIHALHECRRIGQQWMMSSINPIVSTSALLCS